MNQESYNDGKCIRVYRVVGDSTRYEFLSSRAREDGEKLSMTLVLKAVWNVPDRIRRAGDLILSRAKEE